RSFCHIGFDPVALMSSRAQHCSDFRSAPLAGRFEIERHRGNCRSLLRLCILPLVKNSHLPFKEDFLHCLASNFPALRSEQRAGLNQGYVEELQVMLFGYSAANTLDDVWQVIASIISRDFVDNDETFFTFYLCREHYAFTRSQRAMATAQRMFDVFGITVTTANYDQVFQTPGYVKLSTIDESEVAGAQIWSVASVQMRSEDT